MSEGQRKTSYLLAAFGLFAIMTAVVGYSGWYERLTRNRDEAIVTEAERIIDAAQLWFARPVIYGGGDRSFVGLDFQRLGMSDTAGVMTVERAGAKYELQNITANTFDLRVEAPDAMVWEARNIGFDTRPELKLVVK